MAGSNLKELLALPIDPEETFQGGVVGMSEIIGVPDMGQDDELALALWRSINTELVHAEPLPSELRNNLDAFVGVLLRLCSNHDTPFRPRLIECRETGMTKRLRKQLIDSGTEVSFVEEMPEWDDVLRQSRQEINKMEPSLPSLAEIACGEQQMRDFADAAAAFYRTRLWELLDDNDLVQIETPKPPRGLKFATVLGAGGQSYGLGFYDHEEDHYALMSQVGDPRNMELCSLTFDSPASCAPEDVQLWKNLDLPLETGDAFPSVVFIVEGRPRCLTPKELEVVTIVLRSLADTSEEELDSGRWTKWVQNLGKRRKCTLAIPNLLDPPDHQEWIRRGKMPEPRGHEQMFTMMQDFIEAQGGGLSLDELNKALNDKFAGPMDQFAPATDTPEQRADALCQQAIETYGRCRIRLMREALNENPKHVEANLLLAESTRNAEQAAELFRCAKQYGREELGREFEELAGQFWGLHNTRPYMRACQGLAETLRASGRSVEAILEYQEMLRLNPNDNQGVRYELVPLLISFDRDDEALEVLDDYQEESGQWAYMRSLVEYRRCGNTSPAKKSMKSAFRANPHVVEILQSDDPPYIPDSYALGSPEEAMVCLDVLSEAWEESEGYVDWMFGEYFTWERDRAKQLRDKKRKQRKNAANRRGRRK